MVAVSIVRITKNYTARAPDISNPVYVMEYVDWIVRAAIRTELAATATNTRRGSRECSKIPEVPNLRVAKFVSVILLLTAHFLILRCFEVSL